MAEALEVAVRALAADRERVGAVAGQRREATRAGRAAATRTRLRAHSQPSREGGADLVGDRRELRGGDFRRVDRDRKLHDLAALEAGERADDLLARELLVEGEPGAAGKDLGTQAPQDDRGVAVSRPDRSAHPLHLVVERPLPDARRRRDVRAQYADAHPAEAAPRGESLAFAPRALDRGLPLRLDAEIVGARTPAAPVRGEDDGDVRHCARARLEPGDRLAFGEAPDVDAGDPHALGDPVRGAREGEPDEPRGDHADRGEREKSFGKQLPRPRTAAPTQSYRARPGFHPQARQCSAGPGLL